MNINKIVVAGRLGQTPEEKYLPDGRVVTNFSIATNRYWKNDKGEKQEATEWIPCVVFGKTAQVICKYLAKGNQIYIEGRLQTRSWDKDGVKHYKTEVMVDGFQFIDSKSGGKKQDTAEGDQTVEEPAQNELGEQEIRVEDIPF